MDFLWSLYDVIIEDYIWAKFFLWGWVADIILKSEIGLRKVQIWFCNMIMMSKMDHVVKINDFLLFTSKTAHEPSSLPIKIVVHKMSLIYIMSLLNFTVIKIYYGVIFDRRIRKIVTFCNYLWYEYGLNNIYDNRYNEGVKLNVRHHDTTDSLRIHVDAILHV